ncbi:Calx-beta domain-containing protein [Vibrio furnissii]|uniref:Calx-beta domain-containing protein n=1 Tax=Vibrio furnissii TaxID=29494 RepID=UPI001F558549|nr:hypothetical protein [Vibrio furnissii]
MSVNSLVFSGILSANQMIVIDVNGNIRTALIGEKLPQGTVIVQRGDDISDEAALKTQIIDANNNPQDITDDVARIFAALEEGQDPTQVDEELAPAAGGGQGSALTAAATVERIGSETIAITSFDTTGFESLGLSQTQSLALSSVLVTSAASSADATSENPTVSTISSSEVDEGQDAVFTVTLSNASSSATTYEFDLGGATDTAGSDDYSSSVTFSNGVTYDSETGLITVPAGVTSFTATVQTTQDTIDEANETFTLTVGNGTDVATGTATIIDDDAAPTITSVSDAVVSANDATVDEGQDAVFTVTLSNASSSATTYEFDLGGATDTAGSDDYSSSVTFSNGVTYDSETGLITVPAGVTSFTATVQTTQDTIDEANETFTLTVGNGTDVATGTATIIDDDAAPTITSVSDAVVSANDATVDEGQDAVFTVTLSNASSSATTYEFDLGGATDTAGSDDYSSSVTFSNGVTYDSETGLITVPAGVTSFTATVQTTQDTIDEANETFTLTVGNGTDVATGTATIIDDDAAPTITSVSDAVVSANDATVDEGQDAVFTVTLSNASSSATTYEFDLGGATDTAGSDDYSSSVTFSNGVTYDSETGLITVPAGVTSFTATVQTTQDTIDEANETFTLTVGNGTDVATGTATIIDDDAAPTITSVSDAVVSANDATVDEGQDAVFTVTLSNASSSATTYEFDLGGATDTAGSDDYSSSVTFSNGVTYDSETGLITVPAGVTSFTATVQTTQDTIDEANETFTLTVGNGTDVATGTATIIDDDAAPTITSVSDAVVSANDATVDEGQDAVFTVTLSNASSSATTYEFDLGGATDTAGSDDYSSSVTFSNGVTYDSETGLITVPAGVTSFTATVQTTQDTIDEANETFTLTVGNGTDVATGTATIIDDDAAPTITSVSDAVVSANDATVDEGQDAVFTVTLSNASSSATTYEFDLGGATDTAGSDDYSSSVTFSNGVTYDSETGLITVPAGVTSFTATVQTTQDTIDEANETFTLTVGNGTDVATGTATIIDDDAAPTITSVSDAVVSANDATVDEGQDAVFTVTLSNASSSATTYEFDLGGATDTAGSDDYSSSVTFSNGVTYDSETGLITVPAGVTSFTATVQTTQDTIDEANETFTLTVGNGTDVATGTATIIDDDAAPTITSVSDAVVSANDATVDEGQDAVFTVTLSNASSSATTYEFDLGGATDTAGSDDYSSSVTFSNGVTYDSETGLITVPAGVTSFTATVQTTQDTIDEANETFTLTVGNGTDVATGTATIIDDDAAPTITSVSDAVVSANDATVDEGQDAVFTVTLSNASSSATTYEFDLGGATDTAGSDDYSSSVTFSNGVTYDSETGLITVPAGVTSFTATVQTTQDTIDEANETFTLTVGNGTDVATGTATIIDDDAAPTITSVSDAVVSANDATVDEGQDAVFTVTLSNASSSATTYEFDLGGATDTAGSDDYSSSVTFSNGVTYDSETGLITVPAGVTSFTATVQTTQDTIDEANETFTLTVGNGTDVATGTATIIDDDAAPTITSVSDAVVSANDATVDEGQDAVFTVTLSNASSSATTYEFDLGGATDTAGSDDYSSSVTFSNGVTYDSETGLITVPAGVTSFTATVQTTQDTIDEANETFTLTVGNGTDVATGTATIIDDDAAPTITSVSDAVVSANDATVDEGQDAVFTVTLSNASSSATTYEFDLGGATDTAGSDDYSSSVTFSNGVTYDSETGLITVPAGVTSFTATVQTTQDTIDEANETFTLTVGNGTDVATGTATIIDDDAAPTITSVSDAVVSANDATVDEGQDAVFTVTLSNASSSATTYEFDLGGATDTAGSDDYSSSVTFSNGVTYDSETGLITVPAGVTSFTATVQTTQDTIDEANETFTLTVGNGTDVATGTATIIDDDAAPTITSVSDAVVSANDATWMKVKTRCSP